MQNKKAEQIIEAVRNMTDHEANILEVFISGFRAGKQASDKKSGDGQAIPSMTKAV